VNEVDIPNHSWNAVKLNSRWYLVDATLASGYYFTNENIFIKNYNDGYFLSEPELFLKSHYPLEEKWLLTEEKLTIDQFVKAPLIYGNTYKHNIIPISPEKLITKIFIGEEVTFSLKLLDEAIIEDLSLIINSSFKTEKIKASFQDFSNGLLNLKYSFTKKGSYDVHVKIDNDIVVSYAVEVKKDKNNHNILSSLQTK
jgi:transglutaminase/protease-like cytokinesis protein 3